MDAVKYIEEKERMCKSFPRCGECPIKNSCDPNADEAKEAVAAVEKWVREHPLATNGDKVMELVGDHGGYIGYHNEDLYDYAFEKDWWDAPYKEGRDD